MDASYIYSRLIEGIPADVTVARVVRGLNWTGAQLSDGGTGIAMRLPVDTVPRMFASLTGLSAREAAHAALSWNLEEAAEGMAIINAWYNRSALLDNATQYVYTSACTAGMETRGKEVALIGHLGMADDALTGAKRVRILERDPKPGDYPDAACDFILPACDLVIATGSTFVNKTLPHLLDLSRSAKVLLVGPSVPLCPALLDCGITRLCGLCVTDADAMFSAITERRETGYRYGDAYRIGS